MLTSLFRSRNQQEIHRLFQGRMNRNYSQQIRFGKRVAPRANHSEVVWVIPYDAAIGRPDFSRVAPMVTKDCSCEGMSLIHDEPVTSERVLVGLPGNGATGTQFVECLLSHSTHLGYGHYQIGLLPKKIAAVSASDQRELERQLAHIEQRHAEPASAGV